VAIEQGNSQAVSRPLNGEERAVQQAFLHLGRILAEIAASSDAHRDGEQFHENAENAHDDNRQKDPPDPHGTEDMPHASFRVKPKHVRMPRPGKARGTKQERRKRSYDVL